MTRDHVLVNESRAAAQPANPTESPDRLRNAIARCFALLCACFGASLTGVGWACQYTVRDIGFVDLRGPEYTIVIDGFRTEAESRDASALDWLRDTNCRPMFRNGTPNDGSGSPSSAAFAELRDAEGRSIRIAEFQPSAGLEEVSTQIRKALSSPVLNQLRSGAVESFAQIVIVEGRDADANRRARTMAVEAMVAIGKLEPMLPRPLAKPVGRVVLQASDREQESLLLWSLKLEQLPPDQTAAAVLYGRGRLAGPVAVGKEIAVRELLAQLALVGESCECETDRQWNEEPVIPGHWSETFRRQAAASLGFDPDSPLVRAEVVRIVSRGPSTRSAATKSGEPAVDTIEQLLLGYAESVGEPRSDAPRESAGIVEATSSSVNANVVIGSGWDFESSDEGEVTEAVVEETEPPPASRRALATTLWTLLTFGVVSLIIGSSVVWMRRT